MITVTKTTTKIKPLKTYEVPHQQQQSTTPQLIHGPPLIPQAPPPQHPIPQAQYHHPQSLQPQIPHHHQHQRHATTFQQHISHHQPKQYY